MRRILTIVLCFFGFSLYAVEYTPIIPQTQTPAIDMQPSMTMQSVNTSGYMVSGSMYSPIVYEVGSASPTSSSPGSPIRKAPPGVGGESGYDPNNPQFAPIGDAVEPMLLMAMALAGLIYLRRKQVVKS